MIYFLIIKEPQDYLAVPIEIYYFFISLTTVSACGVLTHSLSKLVYVYLYVFIFNLKHLILQFNFIYSHLIIFIYIILYFLQRWKNGGISTHIKPFNNHISRYYLWPEKIIQKATKIPRTKAIIPVSPLAIIKLSNINIPPLQFPLLIFLKIDFY